MLECIVQYRLRRAKRILDRAGLSNCYQVRLDADMPEGGFVAVGPEGNRHIIPLNADKTIDLKGAGNKKLSKAESKPLEQLNETNGKTERNKSWEKRKKQALSIAGREVKKDNKIKPKNEADRNTVQGNIEEAQKTYTGIIAEEKKITSTLLDVAESVNAEMHGLEYSVKTGTSVFNKIARKQEKARKWGKPVPTPDEVVKDMGDIVRYTAICKHNEIANVGNKMRESLEKQGHTVVEVSNKWLDNTNPYNGLHYNIVSPSGQEYELQIHSKESMKVKDTIHPLYEKSRDVKTPQAEKERLNKQMWEISNKLPKPEGIMDIQDEDNREVYRRKKDKGK